MSDMDALLHERLHDLADEARPAADPMPGIRRTARRQGRRRAAGATLAVLGLAAAVAVAVPRLSGAGGEAGNQRLQPAEKPSTAVQSGTPVFARWPYVGDRDLLAAASETDLGSVVDAGVATAAPDATLTGRAWTVWGGRIDQTDALVTVTEVRGSSGLDDVAVLYLRSGSSSRPAVAQRVPPNATELSFAVPAGPGVTQPQVVVVGAPGTGAISYAADGHTFLPAQQQPGYHGSLGPAGDGWAVFTRPVPRGDAIAVRAAGDGALRYQGPIGPPDRGATTTRPIAPCSATDLTVTTGQGSGAVGHAGLPLIFTNAGTGPCTLTGYPAVTLFDAAGQPAVHASHVPRGYLGGLANEPVPTLVLRPGQHAAALLEGVNAPAPGQSSCATYPEMQVAAPGVDHPTRIHSPAPGCSRFQVHPVLPGTTGTEAP